MGIGADGGEAANERRENWLLIKERDDAALPQSGDAVVTDNPLSVTTGRSLDTIAADRDWVWHSNRDDNEKPQVKSAPLEHLPGARKGPMPENIEPQLATLSDEAPEGRMAARDQIRRISAVRPHRGRRGPADHSRRSRLDREILGARA